MQYVTVTSEQKQKGDFSLHLTENHTLNAIFSQRRCSNKFLRRVQFEYVLLWFQVNALSFDGFNYRYEKLNVSYLRARTENKTKITLRDV